MSKMAGLIRPLVSKIDLSYLLRREANAKEY